MFTIGQNPAYVFWTCPTMAWMWITNNEPAFWTSIIQLKVNLEPNNHN